MGIFGHAGVGQACSKINPVQIMLFFTDITQTPAPQVIVMKSKKLEEGGRMGKAACLARNFLTKNISLEMPSKEVLYKQSTAILTSEGLYNAIKVVNVTKGTEATCTAKFDNRTITAEPGTVWWHSCHFFLDTVACGALCSPSGHHCPGQPAEMRNTLGISAGRAERCCKASERNEFSYLIPWRDLILQRRGKTQSISSKCAFPYD